MRQKTISNSFSVTPVYDGAPGTPGANSIRLDISNEMDSVFTNSAGVIQQARTVETIVHLYDGATEVNISAATFSPSGGPASSIATFSQSASGNGKKLSWAFIDGQTMADAYEIVISYTYNGVEYSDVFSVTASKGIAIWQLRPSMAAIPFNRNSDNTLTPASRAVGLKLLKIDGSSTTEYSSVQTGVVVRYSTTQMPASKTSGSEWSNGDITVLNSAAYLYIAMFNSAGTLLDRETIPVVCDGANGNAGGNAIRLDISNEMDTIFTNSAGVIQLARTVETIVHLYDGATEVDISNVAFSPTGGPGSTIATFSQSASGNGRKLSWAFIASKTMAAAYEITISYTYNSVSYSAVFSIIASKGNAIWQLKPSMSSIPFQRDANNALTPSSRNVGLKLLKIDGNSTNDYTSVQTGIVVRYDTTAMPSSKTAGSGWTSDTETPISVPNTAENLYIAMFSSTGILLDRETIPVVCDGAKGGAGDTIWQAQAFKLFSGDPGNDKPSVTTGITASTTDFGNNWSAVPPVNNASGVSKIDFSEVAGWKSGDNITIPSPGDGKNNTATIRFTTYGANAVVEIKITASSEANYDFGAIGKLDEKVLQSATASQIKNDASLSTVKVSGTGTATAQLTVAEPGEHFVQICYAKDSSSSSGNDNAVVQVLTAVTPESKIYSSVATVANGTVSGSWSNARPWQGATGSDGQSSVLYALEPSRDSLNFRSNAVGDFSPSSITVSCKVKKYVGNEIDVISNPAAAGLYVYYVKNGLLQSWQPGNSCTVNASEALAEQYTVTSVKFVLSTASSSTLVTDANTIVSVLLPVVCDGRRGSVGATGRMFYSMGEWNAGTRYEKTDEVIPMVHYDDGVYNESLGSYGHYWYLNADSAEGTGHEPGTVTNEWRQCDDFGVVITQGLFAQFAKLGSFIMSGDWMISCAGYIYIDGTKTYYGPSSMYSNKPAYLRFDPNYPDSDSGNQNFIPVYAVDGLLGKSYLNDAYIKGTIEASDGHIGGFVINTSQVKSTNGNVVLNSDGTAVIRGKIEGSLRNPVYRIDVSPTGYTKDNIALVQVSGGTTSFPQNVTLNVDGTKSSGRLTRLIAGKWGTSRSYGTTTVTIKDSNDSTKVYPIWEDGLEYNSIKVSNEVVELFGYGDKDVLLGFIVLNRINFLTQYSYGLTKHVLASGTMVHGKEYGTSNREIVVFNSYIFPDGTTRTIERLDRGKWKITFSHGTKGHWFSSVRNVMVEVSGFGFITDGQDENPINATIYKIELRRAKVGDEANYYYSEYIDTDGYHELYVPSGQSYTGTQNYYTIIYVVTNDDTTPNDGGFSFTVSNSNDFSNRH